MLYVISVLYMYICICMCGFFEIYKVVKYILLNLFKKDRCWINFNFCMKFFDIVINLVFEKVYV